MSPTLAIIPAKRHSEGVPGKNWKPITLDERNCVDIATSVGLNTCDRTVLSSDVEFPWMGNLGIVNLARPAELCQPETPMIDVVRHALEQVPGPDDEIIVLLQPTSPLRTAETVKKAIAMLEADHDATSVVSVSPSYPWEWALMEDGGRLLCFDDERMRGARITTLEGLYPDRRQDCEPTYRRDGVVYAFRRNVVERGSIYGEVTLPLHTPPDESLSIDTPADWDEAVRRLSARSSSAGR